MKSGNGFYVARTLCLTVLLSLLSLCAVGQERKVMNRPFIDTRVWHYGFLFGVHFQDQDIANNGFVYSSDGKEESWYAEVPSYSPGFTVGVLGEVRICEYFSARLIPTMYFGDKVVHYHDIRSGNEIRQIVKSTYVAVPVDFKISAPRFNNYRPYIMAGVMPLVDLTAKEQQEMLVKRVDCMLEVGIGMDLYFRYFKLIPELKFCFGLTDILRRDRTDITEPSMLKYTESMNSVHNRMVALTFYFE
ncbi:MAG: PorT family protein [Bacteroidaceae bacterium]|nr:PorT family protein [Bacteroidaceae bacterium]